MRRKLFRKTGFIGIIKKYIALRSVKFIKKKYDNGASLTLAEARLLGRVALNYIDGFDFAKLGRIIDVAMIDEAKNRRNNMIAEPTKQCAEKTGEIYYES